MIPISKIVPQYELGVLIIGLLDFLTDKDLLEQG